MGDEETMRVRSELFGVVSLGWHGYLCKRVFKS